MASKSENDKNSQNYVELGKEDILNKIKEDLNPIQENLAEKKITVDEAKSELKKINEWIQWTKLEQKDKKEIWNAFEKLTKLEKDIDENSLKSEVNEIIKLLEKLTQKDLANLKESIQKNWNQHISERPPEVQEWIQESSKDLDLTINNASEDKNPVARRAWKVMKWLNS